MEQFDCIVIGEDIFSLTTALFLARKMRNVLVVVNEEYKEDDFEVMTITDPENRKYHFEYQRNSLFPAFEEGSLISKYLKTIGLELKSHKATYEKDMIIDLNQSMRERILSFDQYRTYLVRYYPKQRDHIHRFFNDLDRHYQNYVTQYTAMLKNTDYTLTSLMIEWGDYSLLDLLSKYFNDGRLIEEFLLNSPINGISPSKINSYNFFMNFFLGLKDGWVYLDQNSIEIEKALKEKLTIINPKMLMSAKVHHYIKDDQNKVVGFVSDDKKEYRAKYLVVQSDPVDFYTLHFPEKKEEIVHLEQYYPNIKTTTYINTLYLALNQKAAAIGIDELNYFFKNNYDDSHRLIRLFNYQKFDKDVCLASHSALCLDFCYDEESPFAVDEILKRLYDVFPKMKKTVVGTKLGKPKRYLSMLSEESVRKGLSINDQISIESGEHTQLFDNLYVVGKWLRPEASMFGWLHSGIVLADKIEERLYYGEDDDSFYYLTNDEIMMMIRHNYQPSEFNNKERHINFHIGKSDYFVRTKKKNITIHRGVYQDADVTIYSTNDKLSNLLLKKTTFTEVLKSGSFRYLGNMDTLYEVVNNFGLDDFQEYSSTEYQKHKIYFLGIKFLFAYLLVYGGASFLTNYIDPIWLMPPALFISGIGIYFRYRLYLKITWFEIFLLATYFVFIMLRIFLPGFRYIYTDSPYLIVMGSTFFISWALNFPVVYDFHRYDFKEDYAHSILFRVINNGLTFLWALVFLGIFVMTFVSGERYVSVLYNFIFLGIFLSYYYPVLYVKTNIKN
ncbi:MAG: hypothetical protein AB7U79_02645 [Candidatus Izemoplasmatales bacterium]